MFSITGSTQIQTIQDAVSHFSALVSSNDKNTLLLTFTSTCLVSSVICVSLYLRKKHKYWSKKDVKGPKPTFLVGNFIELFRRKGQLDLEWLKKYGKVYGIYMGLKPVLVVSDPEVMQQICVKDFDTFYDHTVPNFLNKYQEKILILMKGEHWKRVRAMMTPTFTSGKIKRMFRFMDGCADDLIEAFLEELQQGQEKSYEGAKVDVAEMYKLFSMDVISACCYGLKLHRTNTTKLQNSKSTLSREEFIRLSEPIIKFRAIRELITLCIPKSVLRLVGYQHTPTSVYQPMANKVGKLIEARKKTEKKFDDYLQLLVDAKLEDKIELNEMDEEENHHAGLTSESLQNDYERIAEQVRVANGSVNGSAFTGLDSNRNSPKASLNDLEIVANAVFILAVGLDTTSTLLTHATYALAHNQDIQERLYEEILKLAQYNDDKTKFWFDYESLTSCRYLDAVLSETLRRLSPVHTLDRVASKDYYLEKYNIHLPAGATVNMNWHTVMNDPDYWEEPEKFSPDRFMPENKDKIVPGSYCPFGLGPRHCIGMRFSLTEAKLGMAKMMMNFKFLPVPSSPFPPKIVRALIVTEIEHPEVIIVPRTSL